MNKTIFFGLLLVLVATITKTTSFVYPPPVPQPAVEKIPTAISKDKESSSSESKGSSSSEHKESSSSSWSSSSSSEGISDDHYGKREHSFESVHDKEQMLCNVIVRVTHDLHVQQSKSAEEISTYLYADCKNLANEDLIEQCREMVTEHSGKIYDHVKNGMEISQICEKIEDRNEIKLDEDKKAECSREGGDKCRCCKMHVEKRKLRLRYIVKQIARKRMCMCKRSHRPHRCRQWIRQREQHALRKIAKICPRYVCKHLGYCDELPKDSNAEKLLVKSVVDTVVGSPSLWVELLHQQLETHMTKDVCGEFEKMQPLCIHLAASIDSRRYTNSYMAILYNDSTWIDYELREKLQSAQVGINADRCGSCKNVIQSSTNFYLQILETTHHTLESTCERFPEKVKCEEFFKKQRDIISDYLHSLKPDTFCSELRHCSSSSPDTLHPVNNREECVTCVQRLQPRKDAATRVIDQLSAYFTDHCAKVNMPQCQQFVSEMVTEARSFINEFDVEGTCLAMGFCGQNAAHNIDDYEHAFIDEIGTNVCPMLGPFEALCQQVVHGDGKQVQTVSLNATNVHDFFQHCEEKADDQNTAVATKDRCSESKDKCECCIQRVIQKKKCLKKRVAKYVWHMSQLCKRCPAREKCERYWEEKKARWDAKIDKICPKKACIRMGYCGKAEASSVCANMGPFKQVCEQALNTVGQLFQENHEQPLAVLTNHVSVQPEDKNEKQSVANKP